MENPKEKDQGSSVRKPQRRSNTVALLDLSFKTLLNTSDIADEIRKGEVTGMKRVEESGKFLCTALRLNNNSVVDLNDLGDTLDLLFDDPNSIEWIDLSFNDLTSITGLLGKMKNLKVIYLHGNTLDKIQEINTLSSLPHLKTLTLHGNPVESEKGYRQYVLSALPNLKTLDFSAVTKQDRSTAETWYKMYGGAKRHKRKRLFYFMMPSNSSWHSSSLSHASCYNSDCCCNGEIPSTMGSCPTQFVHRSGAIACSTHHGIYLQPDALPDAKSL